MRVKLKFDSIKETKPAEYLSRFVFGGVVAPQSLDSAALSGMFPFAAVLAIVALGQTLVIQQGGLDLSGRHARARCRRH